MRDALIDAVRAGDSSRVERILTKGLDPNFHVPAESDHGDFLDQVTPLMVAVAAPKANAEIVRSLLAHGADPFAVSEGEVSPTWYASGGGTGYPPTEKYLRTLEPDHPYRSWGGGDAERLRLILDAGGDPKEWASNGRSCVFEACSVGDPARLELLIERGAEVGPVYHRISDPSTSLKASERKLVDTIRHAMNDSTHRFVPLFAASSSGSLECVKLIVDAGFPVDFELAGQNALTQVGSIEVAEYLWDKGVRPGATRFGLDAIDAAIEADNLCVVQLLLKDSDSATIQQKLLRASGAFMNPRAVRLLVQLGADVNKPDKDFGSPLHYACWQGDGNNGRGNDLVEETVQALLDARADPNLLVKGSRPLHQAVAGDWGSPTSVLVLLRNGAEIEALDDQGQTALMIAAQQGELECVRLLMESGADPARKDRRGKTALDHARTNLKGWNGPGLKLLNWGINKLFNSTRLNKDEWSETARLRAQKAVDLLSNQEE